MATFEPLKRQNYFNVDPEPTFHSNEDPDPASQKADSCESGSRSATLITKYNYFRKFHIQLQVGTVLQCTGNSLLFSDKRLRIAEDEIGKAHDTLLLSNPGKGRRYEYEGDLGKADVGLGRAERTDSILDFLEKNLNSMYSLQVKLVSFITFIIIQA
jgi:hypothetical protein